MFCVWFGMILLMPNPLEEGRTAKTDAGLILTGRANGKEGREAERNTRQFLQSLRGTDPKDVGSHVSSYLEERRK